MHSRIPSCKKALSAFIVSPDFYFRSLRKRSLFALPLFSLLVVQIVIVFLPALFNETNLSMQGVAGILIVVTAITAVKLTVSTVFIYFAGLVSSDASTKLTLRYSLSAAVMTHWIILSGKILAALIGGIRVILNPQLQFEIQSFPNAAQLFRTAGIAVPDFFSGIDAFAVWYIVVLVQMFHSVFKIRFWYSAACSCVNWSLITLTQRGMLLFATPSIHSIPQ